MQNYSSSLLNIKKNPTTNGYILDLKMTQISSLSSIFETVKASDISELILSYNSFQMIDPFVSEMTNLQVLNISVNQIKEITNLENLKKLESLNLSTNRIRNINNIQYLGRLVRLDLSMNYIHKIEGLHNLKLQILNLSSNNISVLENLETLQSLECLDISKNKLQNMGCLEKTPLKSLKRLLCSHNLFPNQYLDKFENTIKSHKYLEELNCMGNEIVLCKEFTAKMSNASFLKILNGVPVFANRPIARKPTEKQKSDIRIGSSHNINDIIDIGIKGSSLQDLQKKKDENIEKKEEKKEDFMDIINMYAIQKSQEKFKKNEEFIKKLKESKVETKPIRIPSPQMLKKDEITSSPKNSSSPSSNKKRPSIFSGKTIEESNRKPPLAIKEMEKLSQIPKQDRKSQTIDPQTASTMIMNYKPHLRVNTMQRSTSKMDSPKELEVSENSKNSKQSKNVSDRSFGSNEEISKPKKIVSSQKDLNKRVPSTHHLTNISINSKISVNTDKLKERLEKFKENSTRRNSENLESKPVDWKEKRKQFLLKKQEKRQEEEILRKSIKTKNLFEEDAKEEEKIKKNTSKACNIF